MRALDENWSVGYLQEKLGWGVSRFEELTTFEHEAIKHLMVYGFGASLSLRPSETCKHKEVLKVLFDRRMATMGDRLKKLGKPEACSEMARGGRRIGWAAHGSYNLVWTEGKVESITHRSTGDMVTLPNVVTISEDIALVDTWDDLGARVELGPVKFLLSSFFQASHQGPFSYSMWRGDSNSFRAEVDEAISEVDDLRKTVQVKGKVTAPEKFMGNENKRTREVAATKARDALKAKQAESSNKRRLSLRGHAIPAPPQQEA